MNNTKQNLELEQLIKKTKLANEQADKCGLSKCRNEYPNIKYILESQKECRKKFEHYPIEKKMQQMMDENKCLEEKKIYANERISLAGCITKKCPKHIDKLMLLGQELVYLTHPKGKELKILNEKDKQLEVDIKVCSDTNCGHIYLTKKLKKDTEACSKLAKGLDFSKQFECLDKKKIPEKTHALFECKKKNCDKIINERKKIVEERFKLIAPNMKKKIEANLSKLFKSSKKTKKNKKSKNM